MNRNNFFQWFGSLLVLISYVSYRYGGYAAPTIGFAASVCLVAWATEARALGYCTLNFILAGVNLWTIYEWQSEPHIVRTFWNQIGGPL